MIEMCVYYNVYVHHGNDPHNKPTNWNNMCEIKGIWMCSAGVRKAASPVIVIVMCDVHRKYSEL